MAVHARKVTVLVTPASVIEGAGVKLKRSIGARELSHLDPLLLFDHFASLDPDDYLAGFPMHPHRGIETVTYVLAGAVRHKDSLANSGVIEAGDVQWMTSGRGIMHEEMPEPRDGKMAGFQLWVNLPARLKMTEPRYREVASATIPEITPEDGVTIRVIAGAVGDVRGPVKEIAVDPVYVDVTVAPRRSFSLTVDADHAVCAYVFEGRARFGPPGVERPVSGPRLAVFGDGDTVHAATDDDPVRFLLFAGRPIREPIARYGPFVMNTRAEIEQALQDLRDGTFVRP